MPIRKLPEYMITRLKAWEVIERPASVVKELVENSLDAGATYIKVSINDGGKSLICVEDDGSGIELTDMDLLLENYTTSKIYGEQDLLNLKTYGFRWESLAEIAEVSKVTIISKTWYSEIGTKLVKLGESLTVNHLPVGFDNGTMVLVQDLFYNAPTKLKSLKSSQTEFFFCYNYFVDVALCHYDKSFALRKNDKSIFDLKATDSLMERITQVYKKDYSKNLKHIQTADNEIHLTWFVSDSGLTFGSWDNIKIYINGRPVQDKIIKRALMDAYARQITPNEYPFAVLMLNTQPGVVDVNVNTEKSEIKFSDPQKIYQIVYDAISRIFGEKSHEINKSLQPPFIKGGAAQSAGFRERGDGTKSWMPLDVDQDLIIGDYKIIGQLWDNYIILQWNDGIYYIDQQALAERIVFEKMKKDIKIESNLKPDILLQPLLLEIPKVANIDDKIAKVNELWFDCSVFSENRIIAYAMPQIFVMYKVDLEKLFAHILLLDQIDFVTVLDQILIGRACKTSVKAGNTMSLFQMIELVKEGFDMMENMFTSPSGKPFFVKSDKKELDKFFER